VEAIWRLALPVEERAISELAWMLDLPVWPGPEGPYTLTPHAVLVAPERHAAEFARTLAADTVFPIDITWHRERWVVLDGVHRLLKLERDGAQTVRVRVVPRDALNGG
jgi:hypothetical protein